MMQHITGIPRNQLFFSSLEDTILQENPIRFLSKPYHYKLFDNSIVLTDL